MPRGSCLDCCRKHLSQAVVLMLEAVQGYPLHAWLAVGHMGEAADEMIDEYPAIAEKIREERLSYMLSLDNAMSYSETDGISINDRELYRINLMSIIQDVIIQSLSSGSDDDSENIIYEQ